MVGARVDTRVDIRTLALLTTLLPALIAAGCRVSSTSGSTELGDGKAAGARSSWSVQSAPKPTKRLDG